MASISDSSDGELIEASRAGDREAFGQLAARHGERIARYLATMTGDDAAAHDLKQEALRLAFERLDQLDNPDRFGSWLLSIATNRCRNYLRDEVQRRATGGDDPLPDVPDAGRRSALSSMVRRESAEMLALAIDRLPIALREAFVLFHLEQLDYATMAEVTDVRENTLQVRVHRAKALLRHQLGSVVDTFWQR